MKSVFIRALCCCILFISIFQVRVSFAETMYIQGWSNEDDAFRLFSQTYPNVDIQTTFRTYGETDQLIYQLLYGDSNLDVFSFSSNSFNTQKLFEKGFCYDLSQDTEILAHLEKMHESISSQVRFEDTTLAIPWSVYLHYYSYYPDAWIAAGLNLEDVPMSFSELLDFLEYWIDRIEHKPEDIISICGDFDTETYTTSSYTIYMVELLLENYIMQFNNAQQPLSFDNSVFSDLLERCKHIGEALYRLEPKQKGEFILFKRTTGMQDLAYLVPLRITNDQPILIKANLQLCAIYNGSDYKALGIDFIKSRLACISEEDGAYLYKNATPVEKPNYQETIDFWQENVNGIQQQLDAVTDSYSATYFELSDTLERYTDALNQVSQAENQFLITQQELDIYHTYIQCMYFQEPSIFNPDTTEGQNVQQLCSHFACGVLSSNQFIQKLDNIAQMVEQERK